MMATLYDVDVRTINEHIKKIYSDSELEEDSTIRNFRIVQTEGSRQVTRDTKHYSLQMIIAVGFKVNSERAVQFRKWVNQIAKDYTIKGWVMDDERLKRGMYLTEKYFDEQLERMLNCSHRLRWPRSGYGCQFCHRLHLVAAVNMRFQNVWTCFRFDRIVNILKQRICCSSVFIFTATLKVNVHTGAPRIFFHDAHKLCQEGILGTVRVISQRSKNGCRTVIHDGKHPLDVRPFIDVGQHGRYAGAGFRDGAGGVHLEGEDAHRIQSVSVITQRLIHSGVAHEGPDHTALAL